ncbi:MAG: 3-deoxy-8-phosphooctulonate synthase [Armatimonadota bacterium]
MGVANVGSGIAIGDGGFVLIAGPCVIESPEICMEIGIKAKEICDKNNIKYIFKASYDKANRTSVESYRGLGLEKGLEVLADIKSKLQVPLLTDIHESWQAPIVAEVADILQIPAFLCRQTDLILAAANTGKCVNIKKGQFAAPWDMKNSIAKAKSTGNNDIVLTERGVSFGYNMLIVDMCSFPVMKGLGCPVIFDATHSVQRPGGLGNASGGAREFIPYLVRGASAVGIDGLFMEVHPDPENALCDAASMLALSNLEKVIDSAVAIHRLISENK